MSSSNTTTNTTGNPIRSMAHKILIGVGVGAGVVTIGVLALIAWIVISKRRKKRKAKAFKSKEKISCSAGKPQVQKHDDEKTEEGSESKKKPDEDGAENDVNWIKAKIKDSDSSLSEKTKILKEIRDFRVFNSPGELVQEQDKKWPPDDTFELMKSEEDSTELWQNIPKSKKEIDEPPNCAVGTGTNKRASDQPLAMDVSQKPTEATQVNVFYPVKKIPAKVRSL